MARRSLTALPRLVAVALAVAAAPGTRAQSTDSARAVLNASPGDPDALAGLLLAYDHDPSNRASRSERRSTERRLTRRLLDLDGDHPVGLEMAARWEVDDYLWNATNYVRFRTGYFERKRDEAFVRAEDLLVRLRAVSPGRPVGHERLVALYALAEDWVAMLDAADRLARDRVGDPAADLYRGAALHMLFADEAAADAFDRALGALPTGAAERYRDPSYVVSPEDSSVHGDGSLFWSSRDPRWLTRYNERLTEHMARVVLADLLFGRDGRPGTDRIEGELIVRYGLPSELAATVAPYGRAGVDFWGSVKWWSAPGFSFALEDPYRGGEFRLYSPPAGSGEPSYDIQAKDFIRSTPQTYDHRVEGRRVDIPWSASVLRGRDGLADVVVGYGLPLEGGLPDAPYVTIDVESGVFLTGPAGLVREARARHDRLETTSVVRSGSETLWTDHLELAARPGRYGLSVEFEADRGEVVGFQKDSLLVPAFEADSLTMSDVVLAYLVDDAYEEDGRLVRGNLAIRPAAWGVFEPAQPVYLYFETYGLEVDTTGSSSYSVEAVLAPVDDATGITRAVRRLVGRTPSDGVSVRFDARSGGPDDARYLVLDARDEPPGRYRVRVRITDRLSGRATASERSLWLVEPGETW